MSAHIITALTETLQDMNSDGCYQMYYALGNCKFGDQLNPDEWSVLRSLFLHASKNPDYYQYQAIKDFCYNYALKRLWKEHEEFGYPETLEEWLNKKYLVEKG